MYFNAKWFIYASVNKSIAGSDNDLSLLGKKPLVWRNKVNFDFGNKNNYNLWCKCNLIVYHFDHAWYDMTAMAGTQIILM